jgi:rhodanese-related sulfurtransferase
MAKGHDPDFERLVDEAKTRVLEITPEDVAEGLTRGRDFIVLDVREDHEWAAEHVRGAKHLGRGILERDIATVANKSQEIVLYCGGGYRSALAADNLQKMGYRRVLSMAEGYRGWKSRGLPSER